MKKTYNHPTLAVIRCNHCQPVLTASIPLSDTTTGTQFAPEDFFDVDDDSALDAYFDK